MDYTEFQSPTNLDMNRIRATGYGTVEYGGGDASLVVLFFNKAIHNPQKSLQEGCPQFDNVTFVRIAPPGERLNIVERPATGTDARRFPRQWDQFARNEEQMPEGTPVGLLYPDKPAVEATLRANNIFTIEQLADLSASAIENVGMGCQTWVNSAQKYLKLAEKGVGAAKLRAELEQRDREIKVLTNQVNELSTLVRQLQAQRVQQADIMGQALMSGAMTRPQHMPGVQFDPQMAQINASGSDTRRVNKPQKRQRSKLRA